MIKKLYLLLAIIGTIVPYFFLVNFIYVNGFDLLLLVQQLFANNIATFFAVDFFISCVVFIFFMFHEAKRLSIKKIHWLCLVLLCIVGLSLALPLFLYFREDYVTKKNL